MRNSNTPGPNWDDYIRASVSQQSCDLSRERCSEALTGQRAIIKNLIEAEKPKRIGCLGSGYLTDIPIEAMCDGEKEVHLIDWVPDITREGLRGNIIREEGGSPACVFCNIDCPTRYCSEYHESRAGDYSVCEAFQPAAEAPLLCASFVPTAEPNHIEHDVTSGVGKDFARRIGKLMGNARNADDAIKKASVACRNAANFVDPIPIDDDSLDLITSSMVASQFDWEPYQYFSVLLENAFGRQTILAREADLLPKIEALRAELFAAQMAAHVKEMYRLIEKDNGMVYFSVEFFRTMPDGDYYFLVQQIPNALEILGRYFYFDLGAIPPHQTLKSAEAAEGVSVIQCYVLRPKPAAALAN